MKSYATPFAIAGALLTAALLVATNLITTPGVLWCIPRQSCWRCGRQRVWLCGKKRYTAFSVVISLLLVIAFLAALNRVASAAHAVVPLCGRRSYSSGPLA